MSAYLVERLGQRLSELLQCCRPYPCENCDDPPEISHGEVGCRTVAKAMVEEFLKPPGEPT